MLILFLIWLFLQTTYGQNKALPIALNYLSKTLGTEVKASHVDISFFDEIHLDNVLVFDSEGDTLAYIQKLEGDIGLFSLWNQKLIVDKLKLLGAQINLNQLSEDKFNYDEMLSHLTKKEESDAPKEGNSWLISLDDIEMQNSNLNITNLSNALSIAIPSLDGNFDQFSIQESIYSLDQLISNGIQIDYYKSSNTKVSNEPTKFPTLPIQLSVNNLQLNKTSVNYAPEENNPSKDIHLTQIDLKAKNLSWNEIIQMDLENLLVRNEDGFEISEASSKLFLSDQKASFENTILKTQSSNLDFNGNVTFSSFDQLINHFSEIQTDFELNPSTISKQDIAYINEFVTIQSINLEQLDDLQISGKIRTSSNNLSIRGLNLSSGTQFSVVGSLNTSNYTDLGSSPLNFNIAKIRTSQTYLEQLFPDFTLPEEINNLGKINGAAKGRWSDQKIEFQSYNFQLEHGTRMAGSGEIAGINDPNGPQFQLQFSELKTNLNSLFTDKINLPEEVQRLDDIEYLGTLNGNLHSFEANGNLSSSLGNVEVDGSIDFNKDYTNANYSGYVDMDDFDLGTMLNDTLFGIANFEGDIQGQGLNQDDLDATIDGNVGSFYYDDTTYKDIDINGRYEDHLFEGKIKSNDPNLALEIDGEIELSGENTQIDLTMDLKNLNLKELGFTDSLMVIGGIFKGKIKGNSVDEFLGEGSISNFSFETQKGKYLADSLITIQANEINSTTKKYAINSPFLEGEISGQINPSTLIRFVKNYVKAYIPLELGYDVEAEDNLDTYFEENDDQSFIFSATTKDINPALQPFFGNSLSLNEASLGIYFSSDETRLDVKGRIDSLLYNGVLLQRGSYFFDGRKDFINGNINIEDISMDDEILVPLTTINTVLNNKIADFNLVMADEDDIERLNLGGDFTRTDEYMLTFKDSISLSGSQWTFSPYNKIILEDDGLFMQDVSLSKGKQRMTMYTDENENGEAIEVLFNDFILSELSAIIDKENDYFEGKIDGSLMINSLYSKPFVTADMHLKNITIDGNAAGNLSIEAAQDVETNTVKSNISLYGLQNQATMTLDYGIDDQSTVGELNIKKMEMAIIDPYLTDVFINSEGHINGKVSIKGDLNNLDLNGSMFTHKIKTTPVFTNSRYQVADTEIKFTPTQIDFGTVELIDKNNNSAFVVGEINHKNLRSSVVDLKVNTENFEFLNTTENENELFYGNVNVKGNVSFYGPIDNIELSGTVNAVNSSDFIVSPLALDDGLLADDFIIYGNDPRKKQTDSIQLETEADKFAMPFEVDLNIIVEDDTKFSMVLDPLTGDKIDCYGKSNLSFLLNKDAEMQLFGTYTVTKGIYSFSYGIVNRDFEINPESTVRFNGDPLDGTLNVDAIYMANTSVYNFIKYESNPEDHEISESQRKRDIKIVLNLTDKITKPQIKLDIQQKEDELKTSVTEIVDSKLRLLRDDPDELNKQVFGLLLFGNFILASNAEIDITKTGTDLAISSVSDLVAQQLNKLADGQIAGFEVNFDVNSYSSEFLSKGQEGVITEFGFGVKKNLFNDRLTLSAGTNINLESSSKDVDFNTLVGDFVLDYKMQKDGSIRFKAYRKSSLDRISNLGNTARNGLGIYVRKEFGKIKRKKN